MQFYINLKLVVDYYRQADRWRRYNIDKYEVDDAFVAYHLLKTVTETRGAEWIHYTRFNSFTLGDSVPQTPIFEQMEEILLELEEEYQTPNFWQGFSENHLREKIPFNYRRFRRAISNLHAQDANICFPRLCADAYYARTNVNQFAGPIMDEYVRLLDREDLTP